jgi:hypothetical protein
MSGEKIVRLATLPNNMLVTVEDLAEWVRDGGIEVMALCAVGKDGTVHSAIVGDGMLFTLLGAVTDMQRTITDRIER